MTAKSNELPIFFSFFFFIATCNCDHPVRFAAVKLTAIVNPHLLVSNQDET